ncbi:HIT family protein [Rubricoccus marinus]|uniref:HIT family protein n=1 Tax=Rubricoccus marinus TaxID=716817 RepID=UPI0015C5BC98|nr:HIT family protein [Rubricoccus marinus]
MDTPCAFCDIAAGRISADLVVYRTERVVGFVAREPDAFGHTVLAPTVHCADLFDAPVEVACDLTHAVQSLAQHYRETIGMDGFNLLHASGRAAQQSVPHLHVHLIPRFDGDGLEGWPPLGTPDQTAQDMASQLQMPPSV